MRILRRGTIVPRARFEYGLRPHTGASLKKSILCVLLGLAIVAGLGLPLIGQVFHGAKAPASTQPVDPNKVVLSVGEYKLTAAQFEEFVSDLPPDMQGMARGHGKRMLADQLVQMVLMAGEARRRGLEESPKFKRQMEMIRQQVLSGALQADVRAKVDDAAVQKRPRHHSAAMLTGRARSLKLISWRYWMPSSAMSSPTIFSPSLFNSSMST